MIPQQLSRFRHKSVMSTRSDLVIFLHLLYRRCITTLHCVSEKHGRNWFIQKTTHLNLAQCLIVDLREREREREDKDRQREKPGPAKGSYDQRHPHHISGNSKRSRASYSHNERPKRPKGIFCHPLDGQFPYRDYRYGLCRKSE